MQPGGLLSYMKMAWILKKQYIQFIGDYKNNLLIIKGIKNENINGKLEKVYK